MCNDAKPGWGCDHSSPEALAADQEEDRPSRYRRAKQGELVATTWRGHLLRGSEGGSGENASSGMEGKRGPRYLQQQARPDRPGEVAPDDVGYEYTPPTESELELGISEGRSAKCICVNRAGKPQGHLDIGAMKVGDVDFQETEVELNLKLLDPSVHGKDGRRNLLFEALLLRGRALQREGGSSGQLNFFSLDQKDKDAIGTVTAEVSSDIYIYIFPWTYILHIEPILTSIFPPSLLLYTQVIAINLDMSMKKKGVVLDSVAHIDVLFTPDEPEPEEEIVPEDAVADGSGSSATHSKGGEVAQRDPDSRGEAGSAKRDRGGGKLSVSLLVRGHHNRNLNVDFDFIVQDSINRDTHNIRRQLTHYNSNCRDQTAKVMDEGYTLDDFLEIHTNRGVEKPVNLDRRQQQQQATDEDAFSSACNQNQILPEYFEQSLGGIQVETAEDSYTVDDGGASPWAIVGGIVAAGVLAIIGAGFLFRRALKKKQEKAQEARVTHLVVDDGVGGVDAKDPKNAETMKEKGGGKSGKGNRGIAYALPGEDSEPSTVQETFQRRGIAGVFSREIGNVRAALTSERSRMARNGSRRKSTGETHGDSIQSGSGTGSGTHSDRNLSDLADHVDEQAEQGNRPNRSGLSRRPSQDDLTVGIRRHASDGAAQDELRRSRCDTDIPDGHHLSSNNNSDPGAGDMDDEEGGDQFEASGLAMNLGALDRLSSAANNNSRGGDASVAVSVTPSMVSCNSRNAAPKIVKVDFLESDSEEDEEEESSDDDSSDESSSDDDNSSDSDSSSSDDSDASSHHKKRGPTRRTTAGSMDMSAKSGRSTRSGKSGASLDKSGKSVKSGASIDKSSKSGSGSKVSSKKKMKGENKKKTTKEEEAAKKKRKSSKAKDARPSRRSSDPSERDTGIRRHNPGEGGRRSSNYL